MGTNPSHPLEPRRVTDPAPRRSDRAASIGSGFSVYLTFLFRGSFAFAALLISLFLAASSAAQDLMPIESAIGTGTVEQKRDALFQIRNLRSEVASRAAIPALTDADPIVRATAAASVIFLPKPEAVAVLAPLLNDKDAFVRKEAAYALGKVESPDAAVPLLQLLSREKDLETKAAVIIALGQTGNRAAVEPLVAILKEKPGEDEEFLRRAAARSIGQIAQIRRTGQVPVVTPQSYLPEKFKDLTGDDLTTQFPVFSAAVVTLSSVLQSQREADDTRREAAFALGSIGSRSSQLVLRTASNSPDPYLAESAREALSKLAGTNPAS